LNMLANFEQISLGIIGACLAGMGRWLGKE
jgi:hypothetical protein